MQVLCRIVPHRGVTRFRVRLLAYLVDQTASWPSGSYCQRLWVGGQKLWVWPGALSGGLGADLGQLRGLGTVLSRCGGQSQPKMATEIAAK
jgi:hypothetical protein